MTNIKKAIKALKKDNLRGLTFDNLGTVNKNVISLGELIIWFSYNTPVGFYHPSTGHENIVRKNEWSNTTGKLLNIINPDKKSRIDGQLFITKLNKLLEKFNLKYY